ncbi:DUF2382 domain-containing protein [Capilliphycus salinus ALCB114379]|uniref:DUF2382 domain-containing protein n=1 Tax=Capilliphycus salinus TaxID=2768948 RepID=UPI0039A494BE
MKTQDSYPSVSPHQNLSNPQELQTYSVVDERGESIGQVERIYKNESDQIQILFSLPGQSRPLFRVHQKSIVKVDLANNKFVINLTEKMREKLDEHSAYFSQSISDENRIKSVEQSEDEIEETTEFGDESFPQTVDSETVRLLAERLEVKHDRKKIGEVIVRKQVETEIVEVPIRREKLIIEQVGSTDKPLAEVDLSRGKIQGIELEQLKTKPHQVTVKGEFLSLKAAADLLQIIAMEDAHGCAKVRVELVLDDPQYQQQYQDLFDRCINKS